MNWTRVYPELRRARRWLGMALALGGTGLSSVKRRVLGLKLAYDVRKAIYTHTLSLGAV